MCRCNATGNRKQGQRQCAGTRMLRQAPGPHLQLQALSAHIVLVDALEAGGAGTGGEGGCKGETRGQEW